MTGLPASSRALTANRVLRVGSPALLVLAAVAALLVALAIGGGIAGEAAAWVTTGVPAAQLLIDLAASVTIGPLLLAAFALSPGDRRWGRALDTAAGAAAIWTVAALAMGVLSLLAQSPDPQSFGASLLQYLTQIPEGQAWLASAVGAAILTVLCVAVRSATGAGLLVLATVAVMTPMALIGHAGNAPGDHDAAVGALGLHIVGAAAWLGGLVALVLLGVGTRGDRLADLAGRYSSLALLAFLVVGASGVWSAWIRLADLTNIATPYGALLVVKTAALALAGAFGAVYRTSLLPRIRTAAGPRTFFAFVAGELVVLGVASGFAAALGVTAPPDLPVTPLSTPAEILTGQPLPPPMTAITLLGQWRFDPLWVGACALLLGFYVAGVVRLRRRGDVWPIARTVSWSVGVLLLAWLTSGGLEVYQEVLFSAHMLLHMALTMVVPLLLVPAAPVTLALRAIRRRGDGSRGGREWILWAVHSRLGRLVAHPLVAAVLFAGSLVVFYWSPLFGWASTDHIGHEWMTLHFLVVGYLFVQSLVGVDPVPFRFPYPIRLLVLLATMAFHAFFGLALIEGTALLLPDWYGAMGWGTSALADQQAAGGVAWSVGEIPTLALAVAVAVAWSRSDERESRRLDRHADRSGDTERAAYNEMLARLQRSRA